MRTVNVIEGIFFAALEKQTPVERNNYLDEACTGDPELRRCVERMLDAQPKIGDFLQRSAPAPSATTDEPPLVEKPGVVIGPYKLLQELGEGGFGVVFMAEQEQPVRRKVALKIIKPGMDSKQVVARFEAERQALAIMDHPNIARVLDGGTTESGRPYFVMELVKGIPITEFCDQNRLTPRERLELFIPVCQAVQHAHQKGIIHRDIKPSNVLVTMYDNKPVPKVIDFGVAKAIEQKLTEQTLFTRVGQIIGTLEYMSPEQASLNALDVDTRADVYALGVLLYELLTGTTPLNKERLKEVAFLELLRLIREEEPPRPSMRLSESGDALTAFAVYRQTDTQKLPALVKGELDWIAMKALEKDRTRRYDTANALAADVQHYLKDEPVEACPPTLGYRMQKYVRRHKAFISTLSAVAALLLMGIATTSWQAARALRAEGDALYELKNAETARTAEAEQRALAVAAAAEAKINEQKAKEAGDEALRLAKQEEAARKRADKERLEADLARQKAVDNETKAEWRLYASHMASAQREWESDNVPLLYDYLNLSRKDFRGWEHDYLYTLANQYQQLLPVPAKNAYRLAFSPDDQRLAIAAWGSGLGEQFGKLAGEVQVWDLASGKVVLTLKDTWGPIAFSPDGTRLATSWHHTEGGNAANGFRYKTEGKVKVWDAVTGKEIFSLPGYTGVIDRVVFSRDGKSLATFSYTTSAYEWKSWDMESGKEVKGPNLLVDVGVISPDGKQRAGAQRGSVKVWDLASGKELKAFKYHTESRWGTGPTVAFSPDGKRLAATFVVDDYASNGYVKVWELATGREVFTFKSARAGPLSFSHDGKRFISAPAETMMGTARTDTVKVYELASGQEVCTLRGPSGLLAFSHDGKRVASVGPDGVRIWDLANSPDCLTLTGNKSDARGLAFSPDSKHLAGPSSDLSVKIWEAASGREIRTFKGHTRLVTSVAFSPDGKQLASSSWDKTVKLWDPASGKEIRTIQGHTNKVESVAFSPDGNYLASAERTDKTAYRGTVRLWELASGKEVLTIKGNWGALAFSPDSKSLATSFAGVVKVVDVASGREIMTGKGHAAVSVAFSPDGKRLASASTDKTIKLWDQASGQELMTLRGHRDQVLSVAFSPDGKRLASSGDDNSVKIWDAATGQEVLTLKGHAASVQYVTFSPDGRRLASASPDGTIKIWDASKSMKIAEQK